MKSDSFRFSRKATTVLLLCSGLVVGHPLATWAEEGTTAVQVMQQQFIVKGTVNDVMGPVIGASVVEKGNPTNGTITDIDGNFSLSVKPNTTLIVSYIGYKSQEVLVVAGKPLIIKLIEDNEILEEVVVVGYGSQKKKDLTGSVASVSDEQFKDLATGDVGQVLVGRIPGLDIIGNNVEPGGSSQIRLRGNRSFVASNDPLIILDGMIFNGSMNDINPYDIETIDVLKDASSTAIYGSRGSNGVIIITTKRGKLGKPQVMLDSYVGVQSAYGTVPVLNAEEYVEFMREAFRAKGQYPDTPNDEADHGILGDLMFNNYKAGQSVDWQDMVLRDAFQQKHQLTIMGGSEAVRYNVTASAYTQQGIVKSTDFERFTIRPSIEVNFSKKLKAGLNTLLSYNVRKSKINASLALEDAMFNSPLGSPVEEDGTPRFDPANNGYRKHPLSDLLFDSHRWEAKRWAAYISSYAEYHILPELTYRLNLGVDANIGTTKQASGDKSLERRGSLSNAYIDDAQYMRTNYESILTYDKTFNDIHHLTVTAIQGWQTSYMEKERIELQDLPYVPARWHNIATAGTVTAQSSDMQKSALLSFAGRVFYGLYDKYLLTLSMRADGASQFSPGHKWGYFPSAALAWRMSEEAFLKDVNWLSNLKLRLSYGVSGNQAISPYQTQGSLTNTIYSFGASTAALGLRPGELANKNLKWESTTVYNLGLDFGFFNGRINGNIEIYKSKTTDLLMKRKLPSTTGFAEVLENVGATQNKGIEWALHTQNIQNKNFQWNSDLTFYLNREEIVELYNGKVDDVGNKWFIGEPIDVYFDYKKIGIWQLGEEEQAKKYGQAPGEIKLQDTNDNGQYDDGDRVILGTKQPDFVLTFGNTFKYKNWDLYADLYTRWGNRAHVGFYNTTSSGYTNRPSGDYWSPTNPTNDLPRPNAQWQYWPFGWTLCDTDGSFIRLRQLTLGYTFSRKLLGKMHLSKLRLYMSGQNLWYWTKSDKIRNMNLEPDTYGEIGRMPSSRTFIFGLNVTF